MRLWIIGNGFDLYHGLKTRYADYKKSLCQKYSCLNEYCREKRKNVPREVCRNCCKNMNCKTDCPVLKFNALPRKEIKEDLWCDIEESCSLDLDALLQRVDGWIKRKDKPNPGEILLDGDLKFARFFMGSELFEWMSEIEDCISKNEKWMRFLDVDGRQDFFVSFN